MGQLRILNARGDTRVCWPRVAGDDPIAQAAIDEAESIVVETLAKGGTAFRIEVDKAVTRLDAFDPNATQIVLVPRMVGG